MLSPEKKQALIELFAIQSESYKETRMITHLLKVCKLNNWTVAKDKHNNVYVTKGQADIYPCVVSHTDTVHSIVDGLIYPTIVEDTLISIHAKHGQVGTGGDDKCGIWVCLEMLHRLPVAKVVFFASEEVGCVGSSKADMKFFADCAFVIQVDRKGNDDFVIEACGTDLCSDDFALEAMQIMKQHRYDICEYGGLTDVVTLVENEIGISCINLSGGYYDPHTKRETVRISDLINVTDMVEKLCVTMGDRKWLHTPTKTYKSSYTNWRDDWRNDSKYADWDGWGRTIPASTKDEEYGSFKDIYNMTDNPDDYYFSFGDNKNGLLDTIEVWNQESWEYVTFLEEYDIEFHKAEIPKIYKHIQKEMERLGLTWNN